MFLRALDLSHAYLQEVPDHIGELLNLRYLNLSANSFSCLPRSLTKLLNLIILDIRFCTNLGELPDDFCKLTSLRHLLVRHTCLKHMPPSREMTEMQWLDYFIVDDATSSGKGNGPDTLAQMKKLRGEVQIQFSKEVDGWVEDALVSGLSGLSASIEKLVLSDYPGMRILSLPTNLVVLELIGCKKLIHLPPLEHFRYLERLQLYELDELEYVEGDGCNSAGGQGFTTPAGSSSSCLKKLVLYSLPKLRGWSRKDQPFTLRLGEALASLECLKINKCGTLRKLRFPPAGISGVLSISSCYGLKKIYPPSADSIVLEKLSIAGCPELLMGKNPMSIDWGSLRNLQLLILIGLPELESFSVEALTFLRTPSISECRRLKKLCLRSKNRSVLEELYLNDCPELELWEEDERRGMDFDFLSNLTELLLGRLPQLECFQGEALTSLRRLSFHRCNHLKNVKLPPQDFNIIEELEFKYCEELELWKEETRGVDWDCLPNLRGLDIKSMPLPQRLPDCLQPRNGNKKLRIAESGILFSPLPFGPIVYLLY